MSFIWDVMCAWKRKHEAEVTATAATSAATTSNAEDTDENQPNRQQESSPTKVGDNGESKSKKRKKFGKKCPPSIDSLRVVNAMMARPPNPSVCFYPHPYANPPSRADGLLRYQMNPQPNWGPKARPSRKNDQVQKPPGPKKIRPE